MGIAVREYGVMAASYAHKPDTSNSSFLIIAPLHLAGLFQSWVRLSHEAGQYIAKDDDPNS
jgi:hypothetical protein